MSLLIIERMIEDVVVLDVIGRMTVEDQAHLVSDNVLGCLNEGRRGILLNLLEVSFCDTSGITSLVSSLVHVRSKGGALAIVSLQPHVYRALELTGLLSMFPIFRDVTPAAIWVRESLDQEDDGDA